MIRIRISDEALADEAIVWAVVDCRRNPEWIRDHLE